MPSEPATACFWWATTKRNWADRIWHWSANLLAGKCPPSIRRRQATFDWLHQAIHSRLVRACHDLSEGGLAVAATEMAMAGGLGMQLDIARRSAQTDCPPTEVLFSESNTRFLVEVAARKGRRIPEA